MCLLLLRACTSASHLFGFSLPVFFPDVVFLGFFLDDFLVVFFQHFVDLHQFSSSMVSETMIFRPSDLVESVSCSFPR